jgi:hypothetical protein
MVVSLDELQYELFAYFRGGQLQQFMSSEDLERRVCLELPGTARAVETVETSRICSLRIRPSDVAGILDGF